MLHRSFLVRCASNSGGGDRSALQRNHFRLLDKRHWDLTTPSRALPVVEVLLRSGVVVDGLERSAAKPLWSMSPSMTKKERSLVQKLSAMLHTSTAAPPLTSSSDVRCENEVIRSAYAAACATGKCTISAAVDANFFRHLQLPFQLMLLELLRQQSSRFARQPHKQHAGRRPVEAMGGEYVLAYLVAHGLHHHHFFITIQPAAVHQPARCLVHRDQTLVLI